MLRRFLYPNVRGGVRNDITAEDSTPCRKVNHSYGCSNLQGSFTIHSAELPKGRLRVIATHNSDGYSRRRAEQVLGPW